MSHQEGIGNLPQSKHRSHHNANMGCKLPAFLYLSNIKINYF